MQLKVFSGSGFIDSGLGLGLGSAMRSASPPRIETNSTTKNLKRLYNVMFVFMSVTPTVIRS